MNMDTVIAECPKCGAKRYSWCEEDVVEKLKRHLCSEDITSDFLLEQLKNICEGKEVSLDKDSKEYKKYRREIARKHRATHPEKKLARKAGERLSKKPCEVCGSLEVEAHHDNYKKPWKVRWLCKTHHEEVDTELDKQRKNNVPSS